MPLRRRVVQALPETALRRIARLQHGESPDLGRPVQRPVPRGVTPAAVNSYDAHAVRAGTVRAVRDALDAAQVPYVLVPGARGTVRQVAVSDELRAATLEVLDRIAAAPGWQLLPARREAARTLRLNRVLVSTDGRLLTDPSIGCDVAVWSRTDRDGAVRADGDPHTAGTRLAPRHNPVVAYLTGPAWDRATASPAHWPEPDPMPDPLDVREPVDLVYTWVDGADPAWQRRRTAASGGPAADIRNATSANLARFHSRDELRHSLRSVAMYASWIRRIWLVTDAQVPDWLAADDRITVVDHREIFRDPDVLPVFNSHAIESQLHHIDGLAEQYLYANDDMFFGRPVEPELFFTGNGLARFFLSRQTLDLDPPSARDLPAQSAGKNNRTLLERDFGVRIRYKIRHGVYPQLRTVNAELEQRYPDVFARTAASRLRHPDDHSVPSSLAPYYAYLTGRSVPGEMIYRYQDIARVDAARRLDEFLRERPQVFCINDVDSAESALAEQHAVLAQFYAEYFPVPSPWESGR